MPPKPSGPNPNVMRLKLDCVKAARKMLPKEAPAAEAMQLGRDLYRWIVSDRPRHRRKLQKQLNRQAADALFHAAPDAVVEKSLQVFEARLAKLEGTGQFKSIAASRCGEPDCPHCVSSAGRFSMEGSGRACPTSGPTRKR